MQKCHSAVTKLISNQAVYQYSEQQLLQSRNPHHLNQFFFMKLMLHSCVQLLTLSSNDNIKRATSEKLALDSVSNIWRMYIRPTFTSCMTVLQCTRLFGRCWYYKCGLINNRSGASASSRYKPVLFLFSGTHNDRFYINNQVVNP